MEFVNISGSNNGLDGVTAPIGGSVGRNKSIYLTKLFKKSKNVLNEFDFAYTKRVS